MESDEKSNIILFPDYQKLKENIARMKTELSMLMLEHDELQFVICKNIETAYYLKFGALEHKAYEAQCAALRLKRKIELIQMRRNRQEKVVLSQIEQTLDDEFAEYQKKLNEQIEKMNEALERSRAGVLTDEENKELKKLYRAIVKNLHPDINPDVSEAQIRLFENAVTAYKNGDLATLRIIETMVADKKIPEQTQNAMSVLAEENHRLETILSTIREKIARIKEQYPYTMKAFIDDPQKESQHTEELESILNQYEELIVAYTAKLNEMLGEDNG